MSRNTKDEEQQRAAVTLPDFSKVDASKIAPALGVFDPNLSANLVPRELSNRTWGQQISYYAGISYLCGGAAGGLLGLYKGIGAGKQLPNATLKTNAIINHVSKTATSRANMLGVIGIMFVSYSHLFSIEAHRKKWEHKLAAAVATGATYGVAGGAKSAVAGAAIGAAVFGAYQLATEIEPIKKWLGN
jgi:hypothetical protein